jgi:FtsP/CotA-like multicopper oxidase with cupredoxin domain
LSGRTRCSCGQTVGLLLDVTNPGVWLVHRHVSEHHEGGMLLAFNVAR